jgi:hypothetical protein
VNLPIACTLDSNDGRQRIERWRSLWARGRPTVRHEDEQLVAMFAPGPGVRVELETLASAERRCCAFARWEVAQDPDHAVLRITSTAEGLAAIATMLTAE